MFHLFYEEFCLTLFCLFFACPDCPDVYGQNSVAAGMCVCCSRRCRCVAVRVCCCCCCFGREHEGAVSMSTKSWLIVQGEPSTTNNCWPSRAPKKKETHVRVDGVRKMPRFTAKSQLASQPSLPLKMMATPDPRSR